MGKAREKITPDWASEHPTGQPETNSGTAEEPPAGTRDSSKAPNRKPLAAVAGGGVGGHLAVILTYHLPYLSEPVVIAYTSLLVAGLGFAAAYFIRPEGT